MNFYLKEHLLELARDFYLERRFYVSLIHYQLSLCIKYDIARIYDHTHQQSTTNTGVQGGKI